MVADADINPIIQYKRRRITDLFVELDFELLVEG